jgi:arginyl-tRNA synthetase
MNIFEQLKLAINQIVQDLFAVLPNQNQLSIEFPKNPEHGDLSSNVAMIIAKDLGQPPMLIAEQIKQKLEKLDYVENISIASPGFINLTLAIDVWHKNLQEILDRGDSFADSNLGNGESINIEFLSTNPTGPMHIGHSRCAIYGDALAKLMAKCGYKVTKEYYINDAGAQIDVLAKSVYLRYLEACGEKIAEIPAGLYPGDYLIAVGQALHQKYGVGFSDMQVIREFAVNEMMELIKNDLKLLKVEYDVFFSEKTLHDQGKIDQIVDVLKAKNLVYRGVLTPPKGKKPEDWEEREQLLFKTTEFGDDIDRPLQKSNGDWTYAAADLAYMKNKFERGFNKITMVLGADHLGYKKRMQAAAFSIGEGKIDFDIKFCQLVNFLKNGEPYKMSKRKGTFLTLSDVLDEVNCDIVRFVMLTRRNDQVLDFDFEKVKEQSKDNPVFYVQYANSRVHSILKNAQQINQEYISNIEEKKYDLTKLKAPEDIKLIKMMTSWSKVVEQACIHQEPHRLVFFLIELAAEFHSFWSKGNENKNLRFIIADDFETSLARLVLAKSVSIIIRSAFNILNIEPIERM